MQKCHVFLTFVEKLVFINFNSILCNKIYKRHFRHAFYVRHERSVAERVFNKQVSREVYKRVEYYTFSTTKLTNGTHKRNKQLFLLNVNLNIQTK
jgi:hypothetical protein